MIIFSILRQKYWRTEIDLQRCGFFRNLVRFPLFHIILFRPAFYVPSSSYRRPSTLVGSLTSWHQSSSALLQSSSPSAWPSSPAVGATFSFNADDDVPYISIDAVEADSDDADDVNHDDVESTNAAAEQPRGMRVLPRRNAVSEVRLADFHPHLR